MATRKKRRSTRQKPVEKMKSSMIRFRLTNTEKALIEEAADLEDLGLSAWVRQVVVKKAREIAG